VSTYEGPDGPTGEVRSSVTRPTQDLLHAVLALSSNLDLATVLRRFVQTSADLTGARFAALNVLDARGNSSTFVQVGMAPTVMEMLGRAPRATGVLGQIPAHGVLLLDDLTQHPAFGGLPKGHPPLGSFLGASVRVREQVYGQLYLASKEPGFNSQDVEVVTGLAAAAAVAIENAQLYAAGQRREHWLRAGQEITTMLLSGADEEDALERIAATAREVAEAATAVLILPGFGDAGSRRSSTATAPRTCSAPPCRSTVAPGASSRRGTACSSTRCTVTRRCSSTCCGASAPRSTRR